MTEEEKEKLKADLASLKANADRESERAKRNIDIIGILGLIVFVGFSIFLVTGALTLLLLARS